MELTFATNFSSEPPQKFTLLAAGTELDEHPHPALPEAFAISSLVQHAPLLMQADPE